MKKTGGLNVKRRTFLKTVGAGLTTTALSGLGCNAGLRGVKAGEKRPNILWLISEDTSPDLGCYGNKLVKTPHLDKMAAEGAMFINAFVTGPVCSASRSGFMTGMYQTAIDAHNHRSHRDDGYTLPESVEVITKYFREAGYYTCKLRGTDLQEGRQD